LTRPPVVLLHGTGSTFDANWATFGWPDLLADLGREVVPGSLPGHGPLTGEPAGDPVEVLLRQLPDEQVDAVGFSAGALAVLGAAVAEPARFRRLALIGIGDRMLRLSTDPAPSGGLVGADIATAVEQGADTDDQMGRVFHRMVASAGNDPAAVATFIRTRHPVPTADQLRALPHPVLVALGSADAVAPADQLLALLPDARFRLVPGVDHFATAGDFTCIDAVLEFLAAE
jgi:pimeloyl-ACP methyl ester carboxylesterase